MISRFVPTPWRQLALCELLLLLVPHCNRYKAAFVYAFYVKYSITAAGIFPLVWPANSSTFISSCFGPSEFTQRPNSTTWAVSSKSHDTSQATENAESAVMCLTCMALILYFQPQLSSMAKAFPQILKISILCFKLMSRSSEAIIKHDFTHLNLQ